MGVKISVIGAGSSYSPELVTEFFRNGGRLVDFDRMSLMDVDEKRLRIVGGLVQRMARRQGVKARIDLTGSLDSAVEGSKFVITQMRVGGNQARLLDETIPLRHGVVGQETTGPGGMFKALRTIPAMVKVAKAVRRKAPRAFILNFANPSGMVTEAVLKAVPGTRILGICSAQLGREWWVQKGLGVPVSRIRVKSAGLNHLSWVYRIMLDGRDVTERFFGKLGRRGLGGWPADLLRALRAVPMGYLHYYYSTESMVRWQKAHEKRARTVLRIEKILMRKYADPKLDEPPPELRLRGGQGYSRAMTTMIRALQGTSPRLLPTNVQNAECVSGFARDQVLEIPSRIDQRGARPLPIPDGEIPETVAGLMRAVKSYETLAVSAALKGDLKDALAAMTAHPLVPSVDTGRKILDEMLKAHRRYLPQFR